MGTVVVPRVVSRALSSRRVLSRALSSHPRFVSRALSFVAAVGVVVRSRLLRGRGGCRRTVLCHGRGCCVAAVGVVAPRGVVVAVGVVAPRGVAIAVVALRGVVVAVVAPRVVSRSRPSRRGDWATKDEVSRKTKKKNEKKKVAPAE